MKKYLFVIVTIYLFATGAALAQDTVKSPLQPVLSAYLTLKNELAADRGDSARVAAKVLSEAIDNVAMDKLPADEHKIWMQYEKKLSDDAEHIKETNDLGHQREHFVTLSANMSKMVKELNIHNTDLYIQFCPMAKGGKGAYWVSEQQKISNPYMGKRMPACGKTTETLKANN